MQERQRWHWESSRGLAEMVRTGHLLGRLKELADAGYTVPEEFTRGNEDPPQGERVRLFFERYDLGNHFRSDEPYVEPSCNTRKLSDEEIRQRKEWAAEVKAARLKKNEPDPLPPWEGFTPEGLAELRKALGQGVEGRDEPKYRELREQFRLGREAEKAARVLVLKADEELARKMSEALATWVNLPPRNSRHTTPAAFEEEE
ncbi:hypothetical protein [Streptomyces deccanensis]|uniref:hypothetical protein n=1 Tax=Streptomyces deccanensis TaxID=424188 RepID=UPI001EFBAC96|nr:hypothetical protein [Streptomyces deccanensis]ULR51009.1 hypothetical protein L3078_17840 [Streptomyces deccanensis]